MLTPEHPPQGKLGPEERRAVVEAGKQLKEQLVAAEAAAAAAEQALQREGQRLPNLTHPDVSQPPLYCVLFTFHAAACASECSSGSGT